MIQDAGDLIPVDFAILADLVILLLVLILPLVFHGVERNLEAFLFVMGALSAQAAGVLSARLIIAHRLGIHSRTWARWASRWARQVVSGVLPITVAVVLGIECRETES